MLSDSAVHVAFIESIISERRERVVKCHEHTLRKIVQTMSTYWKEAHRDRRSVIEETKFDVESLRKRRRRDGNYTINSSVFSVFFEFSDVCDFEIFRTLSSIVNFWALIGQKS